MDNIGSVKTFVLERISDFEVIQTFPNDYSELIDIFYIKSLLISNFGENDRTENILSYLYGYRKLIVDLDSKLVSVVDYKDSKEIIEDYLRQNIYSLESKRQESEVKNDVFFSQ